MMRVQFPRPLDAQDTACYQHTRDRWERDGYTVTTTEGCRALSVTAIRPGTGYRRFVKDFVTGTTD